MTNELQKLAFGLIGLIALSWVIRRFYLKEGFLSHGLYPAADDHVILNDYPPIGKDHTSNRNYEENSKDYPIFAVGSYEQITNNLRYYANPDNGTCSRAEFCGAMYHDKSPTPSNIITPLPPVAKEGTRVGYFISEEE